MDRFLVEVQKLPVLYTVFEGIVALSAVVGNLLVLVVFMQDKRLRKVTNFYIASLALADFLVGLVGVPSALLTRMGIPRHSFHGCLTMLSVLIVFCTISILNLVAVSVDRFWAILFPLNYHSKMSSQAAGGIIVSCWIAGALIGFLPLFGINNGPVDSGECLFIPIMSYDFLVFLYFATIVFPALLMAGFYARIYMVVIGQIRTVSTVSSYADEQGERSSSALRRSRTFPVPLLNASSSSSRRQKRRKQKYQRTELDDEPSTTGRETNSSSCSDEMHQRCASPNASDSVSRFRLRTSQLREQEVKPIRFSYSRREVKKAQKLSIIVLFFMICWIPLYTLNALDAFWNEFDPPIWLLDAFIVLSHVNSAVNPLLYAYHMKDFREAFRRLLCECVLRQQELRDRRRRELLTLSGVNVVRKTVSKPGLRNDLNLTSSSYPNSLLDTPELSPSVSFDGRGLKAHHHGLVAALQNVNR